MGSKWTADYEKVEEFYNQGYSDTAISYAIHIKYGLRVDVWTIIHWRKHWNFPSKSAVTAGMLKQKEREACIQRITKGQAKRREMWEKEII